MCYCQGVIVIDGDDVLNERCSTGGGIMEGLHLNCS